MNKQNSALFKSYSLGCIVENATSADSTLRSNGDDEDDSNSQRKMYRVSGVESDIGQSQTNLFNTLLTTGTQLNSKVIKYFF